MRAVVWAAALVTGCFDPSPPEGAPCTSRGACPAGLACDPATATCIAQPADADPSCRCDGDSLACASSTTACALGCAPDPVGAHCRQLVASNHVDAQLARTVTARLAIDADTTLDTDTGAITGATSTGVAYQQTESLGIFAVRELRVAPGATLRVTGTRALAIVAVSATLDGVLDASASCGHTDAACAGAGGGPGAAYGAPPGGCGGGAQGATDNDTNDTGGGGGGGGRDGASGGTVHAIAGGAGGKACLGARLEPLIGGGGGGGGGPGGARAPRGGGGGGAVQISALEELSITGVIDLGGAGGEGGLGAGANAAAGAGGGAGGALLLEAPSIAIGAGAILAANGGGGGGGGNNGISGTAGENGRRSPTPSAGGKTGGAPATDGGAGGAGGIAAATPPPITVTVTSNGGGGGGAVGRILIRTRAALTGGGTISPPADRGTVDAR